MNTANSSFAQVRAAFAALPTAGKVAAVAIVFALVVSVFPAWFLLRAFIGPRPAIPSVSDVEKQTSERASTFGGYVAQVEGRAIFFDPKRIADTPPPAPAENTDAAPTRPSTYGGPALAAMIFDEVWFADGTRVKLGETKGDIKVVAMNPPWDATIAYQGVDFPVKLFERGNVLFKDPARPEAATPKPADATPADPATETEPAKTEPAPPAPADPASTEPSPGTAPPAPPANDPKAPTTGPSIQPAQPSTEPAKDAPR